MRLSLEQIIEATRGRASPPASRLPSPVIVTGVSTDSRTLQPGDLFVPLRGPRADGHTYVADAFRRGAAASLAGQAVQGLPDGAVVIRVEDTLRALGQIAGAYRRTLQITVVGVTGSVGKTTTTRMCAVVLAARLPVAQTREDWNAEIGVPLALLGLRAEHQAAVIEMAMRGRGEIAELVEIAMPSIGVVTVIGESHLERLGTVENVAAAKGELIAGLPADGTAILNADDPRAAALASLCRGRVKTYGLDRTADVRAERVEFTPRGMRFHIVSGGEGIDVGVPAWGRHNVRNALAAAGVAAAMGLSLDAVREGLAGYVPPKMRLQPVQIGDVLVIHDAYNASPASMDAALDVLSEVGRGRRTVAVLGEMKELGTASDRLHSEVGRRVATVAGVVIAVGEGAVPIAEGALACGLSPDRVHRAATNDQAVTVLRDVMRPDDVVLIKGSRAMQMEQIVEALLDERKLRG